MARARKRRLSSGLPEKWAPGRTFDSINAIILTEEDISEAARQLSIKDEQPRLELTEELQAIARHYREQHRETERPPEDWYRTKVGAIQKAAENLLKHLREPQGTALVQLKFRTEQHMGRHLLGGPAEEPASIEQLLDGFVAVCKFCKFESVRGAPNKAHVKTAVTALREVWIKYTSKDFPLNLQSADNRRRKEGSAPVAERGHADAFTSPGPRFVQIMMQRIDPAVRIGAVRTALRDASVNARNVD